MIYTILYIYIGGKIVFHMLFEKVLKIIVLRIIHDITVDAYVFGVQAQRVACLARQSDLGLDLQVQQIPLPR